MNNENSVWVSIIGSIIALFSVWFVKLLFPPRRLLSYKEANTRYIQTDIYERGVYSYVEGAFLAKVRVIRMETVGNYRRIYLKVIESNIADKGHEFVASYNEAFKGYSYGWQWSLRSIEQAEEQGVRTSFG